MKGVVRAFPRGRSWFSPARRARDELVRRRRGPSAALRLGGSAAIAGDTASAERRDGEVGASRADLSARSRRLEAARRRARDGFCGRRRGAVEAPTLPRPYSTTENRIYKPKVCEGREAEAGSRNHRIFPRLPSASGGGRRAPGGDGCSWGGPPSLVGSRHSLGATLTLTRHLGPGALFTRARDVQTGLPGESEWRGSRLAQQRERCALHGGT